MRSLDEFNSGVKKEEINPNQKYPIIWKVQTCELGECKDDRTSHRWSVPASTPAGLMTECYDCHKSRMVYLEKSQNGS